MIRTAPATPGVGLVVRANEVGPIALVELAEGELEAQRDLSVKRPVFSVPVRDIPLPVFPTCQFQKTSGNYLGFPASLAKFREMFDRK